MSTVHICLKDIFDVAVACNVIFYPEDTPFFSGSALTISGAHSILIDADGTGSISLLPGRYTVRFAKITGNTDTLVILVPNEEGTYELKDLICAGNWVLPLRELLQISKNLSDVADPAAAFAAIKQTATKAATGAVQLATQAEVDAGTDAAKAVTAVTLQNAAKWGSKVDASKLPKYLEVADATERLALTSAQVNVGDVVRQLDTMVVYQVVQLDKLGTEDAFNSSVADALHASEATTANLLKGDGQGYSWDAFALASHASSHGAGQSDPVAINASQVTAGTFDVARIPVLPSQIAEVSSGNLTALTTAQQTAIVQGSVVTTTDGNRWVYVGSGDKTLAANYIQLADITPEWSVIANKPTLGTAAAQDASAFATAAQGAKADAALNQTSGDARYSGKIYASFVSVSQTVTNSTTLTDSGVVLTLPVGTYLLDVFYATTGMNYAIQGSKVAVVVASGSATCSKPMVFREAIANGYMSNRTPTYSPLEDGGSTLWLSAPFNTITGNGQNLMVEMRGLIQVTATATIKIQFAQYVASSAGGVTLNIGSHLVATPIQ